jgi:hypothetical protein
MEKTAIAGHLGHITVADSSVMLREREEPQPVAQIVISISVSSPRSPCHKSPRVLRKLAYFRCLRQLQPTWFCKTKRRYKIEAFPLGKV